jgi:hypothetical protein
MFTILYALIFVAIIKVKQNWLTGSGSRFHMLRVGPALFSHDALPHINALAGSARICYVHISIDTTNPKFSPIFYQEHTQTKQAFKNLLLLMRQYHLVLVPLIVIWSNTVDKQIRQNNNTPLSSVESVAPIVNDYTRHLCFLLDVKSVRMNIQYYEGNALSPSRKEPSP